MTLGAGWTLGRTRKLEEYSWSESPPNEAGIGCCIDGYHHRGRAENCEESSLEETRAISLG